MLFLIRAGYIAFYANDPFLPACFSIDGTTENGPQRFHLPGNGNKNPVRKGTGF